jgi:fructose-bisphosphate aldolase class II
MPLVTTRELFAAADQGNYAVGAFNVNNMEIIQAIVQAAEAERSPVILQASQGAIKYAGIEYITGLVKTAAASSPIPMALHLDHGTDFNTIVSCLRHGFTSIMFDGSQYLLDENMERTKKVVEICHAAGVPVEGEIGRIGGVEDDIKVDERDALLSDPHEALTFVEATGVDSLAPAIGSAHGFYKAEPNLDFDRVAKMRELGVTIPLVLHGGSGIPEWQIQKAISMGVRKINIDTELRGEFMNALRAAVAASPNELDPRKVLAPARAAMQARVQEKMRLFGSSGQA